MSKNEQKKPKQTEKSQDPVQLPRIDSQSEKNQKANNKEQKLQNFAEKFVDQRTKIQEQKIESSIVEALEKECQDLGMKYENQVAISRDRSMEIQQLKLVIDKLNSSINEQMKEIMHLRNSKNVVDEQYENLKEMYNNNKREMSKLEADYEEEIQKNQTLNQFYDELKSEYQETKLQLNQKLKAMTIKHDEICEENEELMNRLQMRSEQHKKTDDEKSKQQMTKEQRNIMENERRAEKISKLIEENATLSEKVEESEGLRKKFMEKNNNMEKQIKQLMNERKEFDQTIQQQKKRINDLNALKSTNQKVQEEKIQKLTEQNEKLKNEVQQLKKSKKNNNQQYNKDNSSEDEQPVKAKPQLFGAVDNMKY